jgi:hypothetical protein
MKKLRALQPHRRSQSAATHDAFAEYNDDSTTAIDRLIFSKSRES